MNTCGLAAKKHDKPSGNVSDRGNERGLGLGVSHSLSHHGLSTVRTFGCETAERKRKTQAAKSKSPAAVCFLNFEEILPNK